MTTGNRRSLAMAISLLAGMLEVAGSDTRAQGTASDPRAKEARMEQVGKTFVLDYGQFAVRVRYLSDSELDWEQLKGPAPGLKGKETYRLDEIRPNVYFLSWQEKDTSIVTQVLDFAGERAFTAWISPEKKVERFVGTIRPERRGAKAREFVDGRDTGPDRPPAARPRHDRALRRV